MTSIPFLYKIEKRKLRYRKNALLILTMLILELIWIWFCFDDAIERWTGMEYYAMIYMIPQMVVIFFPLTLAILASRLCDIEHRGNNFKLLCTMEEKKQIYEIKVLEGIKYILLLTASQTIFIFVMSKILGYVQTIPWDNIFFFTLEIFVISISVFLLQLIASLFIENQLIPLVIGLIGSFSGLFTMYVPMLRPFTIWGYYVLLSPVGFWWDEETRDYGVYDVPCQWVKLIIFVIIAIILYVIGKIIFEKKEA